ncbi:MAG: helix-turn-helix transcriptional regulator [Bacillota bacterium]
MERNIRPSLVIDGDAYWTANEVAQYSGVTRQTLWRWRNTGSVPKGRLYRGRIVVFTEIERDAIRSYACRLQSIDTPATACEDHV